MSMFERVHLTVNRNLHSSFEIAYSHPSPVPLVSVQPNMQTLAEFHFASMQDGWLGSARLEVAPS